MNYPAFFDQVKTLSLRDPLAQILGVSADGLIRYSYLDAVKLAGHSCPTVAGAYLMTLKGLEHLYPQGPAERGGLRVELSAAQSEGIAGVIGAVVGMLTGAAGEGGFKGLGGRFSRRDLLRFASGQAAELRLRRLDSGAAVDLAYHPEIAPPPAGLQPLMQRLLSGQASAEEQVEFGRLWQERVRAILIDHADDPRLVQVVPVE
jgi:hypothetical protein